MEQDDTSSTLSHWYGFRLKLIVEGAAIGAITGLLIVAYRLSLSKAGQFLAFAYRSISSNTFLIIPWLVALCVVGIILGAMVRKNPLISGSGIPQTEGVLLGKLEMNWLSVILGKFAGGVLSIGAGLSLGREGPSVQLGAAVGQGFSSVLKRRKVEERYLITGGASAGLAAAFNAPLAGMMFALEELHKNFSPLVLLSSLSAALTAGLVASGFFGLEPVFTFKGLTALPLGDYLYLLPLGIAAGLTGTLFNAVLLGAQKAYSAQTLIPRRAIILVPLLASVAFGLYLPQVLGGGHELIMELISANVPLATLAVLFLAKFCFTMLCYGSGAPGGIFLPLLTVGALAGNIYGSVTGRLFGLDGSFVNNFIILSMAGCFSAIVKAPITGIILITEMTGSFNHLLSVSLVSIVAYIASDLLSSRPIYESLLERILRARGEKDADGGDARKAILEFAVCLGSPLDGKLVRDVAWPPLSLLVAVKRGGREIIPHGDTRILPGDYLIVLTDECERPASQSAISALAGRE